MSAQGDTRETDTQEVLVRTVTALKESVDRLGEILKSEYPKRAEIRSARRTAAVLVVLGLIISSFTTIGVVSTCFLSKAAADLRAPSLCHVMPGFEAAEQRNKRTVQRFQELNTQTEANKRRIERLERRMRAQ